MNKVITDGLALMPPAFAEGLGQWSRQDGRPGSDTYATAPNAALVTADADFGTCLEVVKTDSVTRLRFMGETPMVPGMYLRVSARVKVLAGNMPKVRVGAWAGTASNAAVTGVPLTGPELSLTAYGAVETVSAIIGLGDRTGVDMPWGGAASYGHLGIDLTGQNGGTVRIESIQVEDVTHVFHRTMMDWVDVRDFGAIGDGSTNDRAAFLAADAAAAGREVLVPGGTYRIVGHLTMNSPVRFQGKLQMAAADRLALTQNFDLPSYAEAFGNEETGLKKGLQNLFNQADHEAFDLGGRRVVLTAPLDVQAAVDNKNTYANRRVIRNGQLSAANNANWDDDVVSAQATWAASHAAELRNVANIANIPVGALVTGSTGVGREVYVKAKNVSTGRITLSAPLWGAPAQQTYTFRRFKYLLDFSGFQNLQRFKIKGVEFLCSNRSSGLMLPTDGLVFQIQDCFFTGPKDRGITSSGDGCQGMQIDRNQFLSSEQAARVQDRVSIAFNMNSSDVKVRDNRAVKFRHFGVFGGTGNIITGNHFFQGDNETDGVRTAGLVFTSTNAKSTITGNYVDNCYVEWGNEHDANPDLQSEFSFHGLTVTGNIFFSIGSARWFSFIQIKPYGSGHYINGMTVTDNLFKQTSGQALQQAERVDTTHFPLDMGRTRNLVMTGNTFHGINKLSMNPVTVAAVENTAVNTWEVDLRPHLPFGGEARLAVSALPEGAIKSAANVNIFTQPYATTRHGPGRGAIRLHWSQAVKGTVQLTARCDRN